MEWIKNYQKVYNFHQLITKHVMLCMYTLDGCKGITD